MDKMLALGVVLSASDMLSPVLGKASKKLELMDGKAKALGVSLVKVGTASLALGTAITAPLGAALNSYQDLAAAQGDLTSLGIGDSGIKVISKEAQKFSNMFAGTTAPEFVKASYDIKSGIASLSDEGVAKFTTLSAVTASATKSTTAEMTKLFALGHGIFKDMNETDFEFGDRMSAQIAQAVKSFRTDGSDLSLGISNIGAQAKKMGVSLSEELSIIGNAKGAFDSASNAATGYRAFLDGAGRAQDKLGLSFTDSMGKMLPMVNVLEQIKNKYGDSLGTLAAQQEIKEAFGSSEAVKIINALVDKTDALTASQKELNSATMDNVNAMAKARNKGKEFDILGQKIGNLTSKIGSTFAPMALWMSDAIGDITMSIGSWIDENEGLANVIGTVVAVGGILLTGLGMTAISVGAVTMALPALATAWGIVSGAMAFAKVAVIGLNAALIMNPIGLAITGIATAAALVYSYWEPISDFFGDLWDGVTGIFSSAWDGLTSIFSMSPMELIEGAWGGISGFFSNLWDGAVSMASKAWGKIKGYASSIGDSLKGFWGKTKNFFGFGDDKKETGTTQIGDSVKQISTPGINTTPLPEIKTPQNGAQQTNHIKVNVHNPSSTVDVEKAITNAMKDGGDRGLSDQDV